MYPTRRAGTVGLAGAALAGLALLLARPVLLLGAAGLLGWLLVASAGVLRATRRLDRTLSVDRRLDPGTVLTDDPATVTLDASLAEPSPLSLRVRADPPVAARTEGEPTAALPPGEVDATSTFVVRVGVAGRHAFGRPRHEAT
ncbi:MAG: hypothetical protein V5A85_05830, partial [Haloarculaceae archaeon]